VLASAESRHAGVASGVNNIRREPGVSWATGRGSSAAMTTVTADDIRVLAQSDEEDPVLVVVDGDVRVMAAREAPQGTDGQVIYSQAELLADSGVEVTDLEAETIAAGLTARFT
jgi:hypothetical protein